MLMAKKLVACVECGHLASRQAKACARCGASRSTESRWRRRLSAVVFSVALIAGLLWWAFAPSEPEYQVLERKALGDVLLVSVVTSTMDQILPIAEYLVRVDGGKHFMARVFFYEPGNDIALHRIVWTNDKGMDRCIKASTIDDLTTYHSDCRIIPDVVSVFARQ